MKKMMRVVFLLQSPLCIARRPTAPGQPIETLPYLSGTVVRGSIATAWLQGRRFAELSADEQAIFQQLFLFPNVIFRNGLPLPAHKTDVQVEVVPQTAWAHKHDDIGWLYKEKKGKKGTGVFNQLPTLLCHQDPNADRKGDRLDRFDTPFAFLDENNYKGISVSKRMITRTAIDSQRGTARDQFLYTLDALETGQGFVATMQGQEKQIKVLERVLQKNTILRMGQARSRGLGEVLVEQVVLSHVPDLAQEKKQALAHVRSFTQMVRKRANGPLLDEQGNPLGKDMMLLPVTLESDVLLRDIYLLPSSDPRPSTTLGRYLALPESLEQEMQLHLPGMMQSSHWIGGWDELRRIPRPPQLAIAMRSVWTFRVPSAHLDAAVTWWLQAQQQGLGERCNEGYGQIRLCHPLHMKEKKQ
jgi:CRISPR-associated protein Csx10